MASLTTDKDKKQSHLDPSIKRIWKLQDEHLEAARAARAAKVPLKKKNIGVRRGSPTPTEGDGTKEPDIKRRVASPTVENPSRSLDLSGLPGTPIKPEQEKPAPRSKVANKKLPFDEEFDFGDLGADTLPEFVPPLTREDEEWLEQTYIKEDIPMDDIDEFEFGKLNLLDSLTEEEKLAFEIMQQIDSGDITEEEGEERLADIARELEIAGKQATLQSNFLTRYLNKSCKRSTTIKLKKPATQLTNHINIKF